MVVVLWRGSWLPLLGPGWTKSTHERILVGGFRGKPGAPMWATHSPSIPTTREGGRRGLAGAEGRLHRRQTLEVPASGRLRRPLGVQGVPMPRPARCGPSTPDLQTRSTMGIERFRSKSEPVAITHKPTHNPLPATPSPQCGARGGQGQDISRKKKSDNLQLDLNWNPLIPID